MSISAGIHIFNQIQNIALLDYYLLSLIQQAFMDGKTLFRIFRRNIMKQRTVQKNGHNQLIVA